MTRTATEIRSVCIEGCERIYDKGSDQCDSSVDRT